MVRYIDRSDGHENSLVRCLHKSPTKSRRSAPTLLCGEWFVICTGNQPPSHLSGSLNWKATRLTPNALVEGRNQFRLKQENKLRSFQQTTTPWNVLEPLPTLQNLDCASCHRSHFGSSRLSQAWVGPGSEDAVVFDVFRYSGSCFYQHAPRSPFNALRKCK